ncbi:hypothetical protein [Hymenobacter sp. BT559]|uniref:hypothetical protein n=1 Tax=Hymenobacter sp. BT559 TaxID=2795729 RepID=UPI0018EC5788|nr:hypothetical protein [Hymenobacter sp. BT559]MBJ6142780.1 hypothetical protein [Hymenobacter sp. BT559]
MPQLAVQMVLSKSELVTLCRLGDLRLFELERLASYLRVPPTNFLSSFFLQAGNCKTQKIKISKVAAIQLCVCCWALK